jgi:hypothetical protein
VSFARRAMPDDPDECRMRAHRCIEVAADTADPDLKKKFTDLAEKWNQLATDIEAVKDPPAKHR